MRLLDLFCGHGLAARGYWNSGRFSEIVGVDINPEMSSSYSFDFIYADCMSLPYDFLMSFDFIHASPPCQFYSKLTPNRSQHPRLIPGVKLMLHASGIPHVIENVEGSSFDLKPNLVLDGTYFGLPMRRKRYFYISSSASSHVLLGDKSSTRYLFSPHGDTYLSRSDLEIAYGIQDMNSGWLSNITMHGIEQGIPPIFTEFIARSLIAAPAFIY